jgi:hypothetical protein
MKKILLVASSLLLSTQVQAAPRSPCTQANLNGNYISYQAAINHHFHTGKCEIEITSGVLSGHCKFDPSAENPVNYDGPVLGTATMNANCSAAMTMNFGPVASTFDVQFTPDKQSFIGKFGNNFGVEGITNGTRYSPRLPATPAPQDHHSYDNK